MLYRFFKEKKFRKRKIIEKRSNLRNVWKTQTRLERGPIVATDTCTEFIIIFRRYVIVIWKESPSSKRRALHKGKLDFTALVFFHCLGHFSEYVAIFMLNCVEVSSEFCEYFQKTENYGGLMRFANVFLGNCSTSKMF